MHPQLILAHHLPSGYLLPTSTTYTWLNNAKESVRVPAHQYISYVQKWITGKVTDPALFPTETFSGIPPPLAAGSAAAIAANSDANWLGKSSNFPPNFGSDIRNIYRQMLRCYAHIYHSHWLEFWHLGAYKELNTCFIHFVNVGRLFGLIGDKELEPMAPLLDIWLEKGWLPRPTSSAGAKGVEAKDASSPGAGHGHGQGHGHNHGHSHGHGASSGSGSQGRSQTPTTAGGQPATPV